ncbi:MAG: exonuclease domain-containing protein [Bacteroidota bacterium]
MYAIIDIETTGGSPVHEKITEIAIFIHDGIQVVDEFVTLINPEKYIPGHITGLTGITNEMVADAPKFYEVAKHIVELTEGKLFVAHNSSFDYNFIRNEFKTLGYNFFRKQLCTVKLSRKLIPARKSYSLGKLCAELNININGRHRAAGDAMATVKLFELLLKKNKTIADSVLDEMTLVSTKGFHPDFDRKKIDALPEEPGIYYFHNDRGDIIYIGKSKNIRNRVMSHLLNKSTKKALEMKSNILDISVQKTGNELIALLEESEEIKKHRPLYNKAQRRAYFYYGLYSRFDKRGYLCFSLEKNSADHRKPITTFVNKTEARKIIHHFTEKLNLCQTLTGLDEGAAECFYYRLRQCHGACRGEEPTEDYNKRAIQLINALSMGNESFFIIDAGRHAEERSVVKVYNGKYIGYGFVDINEGISSLETLDECITPKTDNREVQGIIKQYLIKYRVERIIRY